MTLEQWIKKQNENIKLNTEDIENLKKEKHFYQPGEIKTFSYSMIKPFPYFGQSLMKCKVTSKNGFIPYFLSNYKAKDFRLLGCFVSIKTSPIN